MDGEGREGERVKEGRGDRRREGGRVDLSHSLNHRDLLKLME